MGLYIKGEKLPKYGYKELRVCPNGTLEFRDKTDALVRIPNAVIEVKEPHGRLIDADRLADDLEYDAYNEQDCYKANCAMWLRSDVNPTVIEAEGER